MSKFLRTKFLGATKKSVRFGDLRIPFLLFPDDVISLAASFGDTLEWWFEATHKVTEVHFGTSKSVGYRASSGPHQKEPTEMVQARTSPVFWACPTGRRLHRDDVSQLAHKHLRFPLDGLEKFV